MPNEVVETTRVTPADCGALAQADNASVKASAAKDVNLLMTA
jgi:hypothetical protein